MQYILVQNHVLKTTWNFKINVEASKKILLKKSDDDNYYLYSKWLFEKWHLFII